MMGYTVGSAAELVKRLNVRWEATDEPTMKKINRLLLERKEAACALTALEARCAELTVERDRLSAYFRDEAPGDGFEGDVEGWSPIETAIVIMRRCKRDRIEREPVVRPLEWKANQYYPHSLFATGAGEHYSTRLGLTIDEQRTVWYYNGDQYDLLDEAKAAAQADYERRMRSFLSIKESNND